MGFVFEDAGAAGRFTPRYDGGWQPRSLLRRGVDRVQCALPDAAPAEQLALKPVVVARGGAGAPDLALFVLRLPPRLFAVRVAPARHGTGQPHAHPMAHRHPARPVLPLQLGARRRGGGHARVHGGTAVRGGGGRNPRGARSRLRAHASDARAAAQPLRPRAPQPGRWREPRGHQPAMAPPCSKLVRLPGGLLWRGGAHSRQRHTCHLQLVADGVPDAVCARPHRPEPAMRERRARPALLWPRRSQDWRRGGRRRLGGARRRARAKGGGVCPSHLRNVVRAAVANATHGDAGGHSHRDAPQGGGRLVAAGAVSSRCSRHRRRC
mmetsp:Transcript_29816/g.99644  ORF Transcript_29816/g.99644 Transcript_29816/m.99644 type:complete len:323 (-) Transcript_29816:461-1429(-)